MPDKTDATRLRIRIIFGDSGGMLGPGKADLLTLIHETGSIAAAGRRMGMSYKRAWSLVETMNDMFADPVVESSRGGAAHGGAQLTQTGLRVLNLYRSLATKAAKAVAADMAALEGLLGRGTTDMSREK